MATTTTNFGWDIPQSTDLVKDGATAIAALGQDIDTALVDLKGGTTGQILAKASNTDLDYSWITNDVGDITAVTAGTGISGGGTTGAVTVTNSMATAIDAKGDLIAGTGADAFSRLAVGANGQFLTADSAEATGLKWASAASGFTLISKTTITAATTTNVDSVFTSTYRNYKVILTGTSTTTDYMNFRFRTSGTSNSNANYEMYLNRWNGTNAVQNAQTQVNSSGGGTLACMVEMDVFNPQNTNRTQFWQTSHGWQSTSSYDIRNYLGFFNNTTQFDGISFFMSSGTFTGNLYIYGYGE